MGMSLTVDRVKLLEQLKARRNEVNAYYDGEKAKLQATLDAMNTSSSAWAEYHRLLAEGLAKGDYVYDNGKVRPAVPANYRLRQSPDHEHVPLPDKPGSNAPGRFGPRQEVENNLAQIDAYYRERDVAPFGAAIAILDLSDDEKITIEGSDYDRLLSAPISRNFRWF